MLTAEQCTLFYTLVLINLITNKATSSFSTSLINKRPALFVFATFQVAAPITAGELIPSGMSISLHILFSLAFISANHQTLATSLCPVHNLSITGMSMLATSVIVSLGWELIVPRTTPTITSVTTVWLHLLFSLKFTITSLGIMSTKIF
jgi:hypothetical protein